MSPPVASEQSEPATMPLWKQPMFLKGWLVALRVAQVIAAFIMTVPSGMTADGARKARVALKSVGLNPDTFTLAGAPAPGPKQPGATAPVGSSTLGAGAPGLGAGLGAGVPGLTAAQQQQVTQASQWAQQMANQWGQAVNQAFQSAGTGRKLLATPSFVGYGTDDVMALYIIIILFAFLTMGICGLWLLYTLAPARRAAAPKLFTRCNANACSHYTWDLIWDIVLALFWLAITIASGHMAMWSTQGACATLAAVLVVLLIMSAAATFGLRALMPPVATPAEASAVDEASGEKEGKKDIEAPAPTEAPATVELAAHVTPVEPAADQK